MPRPKLISDDQVLDATRRVMLRQGVVGFTLSDVAEEVGLSRAALIQRFANRAGLEARVAAHGLEALRQLIGGETIGNKGPAVALAFLETVLESFEIPVLLSDEASSNLLRDAIVARLDEPSRQRAGEVADTLIALLQGAAAQGRGNAHVASRLRLALRLIYGGQPKGT
jgi:TetR/AcrR family macrolide resistance operon transcriptional repressor